MKAIDIIILSWDRTDDTIAAIQSGCDQQDISPRVKVVDQGTKPHDLARLKAFCDGHDAVEVRYNTENSGVAGGRNQASAMGDADYIVALDNDAVFADPTVCARAAAYMDAHPEIGALGFAVNVHDSPADNPVPDKSSWSYGPLEPANWTARTFPAKQFCGAGHMIRRSAFDEVGAYDDTLFFMHEEIDLCDRLMNAGYKIVYNGDFAVRHKVSAEHRVHWKGPRYRFHLRNHVYLMMKQKAPAFDVFSELMVMTVAGFRAGFVKASLGGFFGVLKLWPEARRQARTNAFLKRTPDAAAHIASFEALHRQETPPPPWQNAPKLWQLVCRLRWDTLWAKDLRGEA
ncbi:MAG: glycosyltransferase family 2 protein [Pseudomonadota bacterium]